MLMCFKCGMSRSGTKRWRHPPYECKTLGCTGQSIPVSKDLIQVTGKLLSLGYRVLSAEDTLTVIDLSQLSISLAHIELGSRYDACVFPDLPDEWTFHTYPNGGDTSRLVMAEQYTSYGAIPPQWLLRGIIKELYDYLCALEESHAHDIFTLAGWL